jgi:hypothetical protein
VAKKTPHKGIYSYVHPTEIAREIALVAGKRKGPGGPGGRY